VFETTKRKDLHMPTKTSEELYALFVNSRFNLQQHDFRSISTESFVELIEVKDPLPNRKKFILHCFNSNQATSYFTEWDSLDAAGKAFEVTDGFPSQHVENLFQNMPGFCGLFEYQANEKPWFYES
jgi:hypothetical protein